MKTLLRCALLIAVALGAAPACAQSNDPFDLISQDRLFAYLEDLTAIEAYSGWRNSGTVGEAQALDYVEETLGTFSYLQDLGVETERERFNVFMATELWETRLYLTVDGAEVEVPADGLRGPRDELPQALRFDSDGALGDAESNPVEAGGAVVLIETAADIQALDPADVAGKIVFLNYAAINRVTARNAIPNAWTVIDAAPAGVVLVTQFSNKRGSSHGAFVGDGSAMNFVESDYNPPVLYARLEDMGGAGVESWDDLAKLEAARLTWDADIILPAPSGNLVARIPGADAGRAIILSAHIDSPNCPGAMDDGSGSAILLEVARVLNASETQPPVDLYLVWYGSEELWLYGSGHFTATHQDVLDRALGLLQIDALGAPLDGIHTYINLVGWPYGRHGDASLPWPDHVTNLAAALGIETVPVEYYGIESDNSSSSGYGVPNANLIYMNGPAMEAGGGVHYNSHWHEAYDTVETTRRVADVFEEMARVALATALNPPAESLRVTPEPDRRALVVASHTESIHFLPSTLIEFGMTLAWAGFDVDVIPYGQPVTADDLAGVDLVVTLPVHDYPLNGDTYDEAWTEEEVEVLEAYVAEGGFLVMTNSARRPKFSNQVYDLNEDVLDANALAKRFKVAYQDTGLSATQAKAAGSHPLTQGFRTLELAGSNAVPLAAAGGDVLAQVGDAPVMALVAHGAGEVLALGDIGMLNGGWEDLPNLRFWQNLAEYARAR